MKLLIDAGNTRIKWALSDNGAWQRSGVLPVAQAGELPALFAGERDIRQIIVSNVAGEEVARQIRNIGVEQSTRPIFIAAKEMQCGVRNGYSNAAQLGSDRWAALIAAWHLVQGKCLVVSCGTAITIDTLSARGEFLGGLIVPGVELMQRCLAGATDQLKFEWLSATRGRYVPFPQNTADAMFSGAIQAACGAIQRQHALLEDADATVVLSGGAAGLLQENIGLPLRVVDNLVLQGLRLISQESDVQ